jgi:uncharacterized protein (DUF1015 family)
MPILEPFRGLRPTTDNAASYASMPFDTVSEHYASDERSKGMSKFLGITLPAFYGQGSAKDTLNELISSGIYRQDEAESFYLYAITQNSRPCYGIIGCLSAAEYGAGIIKRHENIFSSKSLERAKHISNLQMHDEPVFIAAPDNIDISLIIEDTCLVEPEYSFALPDGTSHQFWIIAGQAKINRLKDVFANEIGSLYIIDGHHITEAALIASKNLANQSAGLFMAWIVPMAQITPGPYHRCVSSDKGNYAITQAIIAQGNAEELSSAFFPSSPYEIGMCADGRWHKLSLSHTSRLSASEFFENLLKEVIEPKCGQIEVGFIGGAKMLEDFFSSPDKGVLFTIPAVEMSDIVKAADNAAPMPKKSTWVEPKPRSGLVSHIWHK